MGAMRKIARLVLQYVIGLIFAWGIVRLLGIVCVLCLMWYCKAFLPPIPQSPYHGYDEFIAFIYNYFMIFGSLPIGSVSGIFLVDKLFFKSVSHYVWRIITGFIMGILGSAVVCWVFPFWGIENTLTLYRVLPSLGINTEGWMRATTSSCATYLFLTCGGDESYFLMSTLFVLIGYNAVGLFKCKKDKAVICN